VGVVTIGRRTTARGLPGARSRPDHDRWSDPHSAP
jgi:hypothetical protein